MTKQESHDFRRGSIKKVMIIPLVVLLLAGVGCDTKQKGPSNLSVGRSKLIDSGNALEAVEHLEKAEQEEVNKLEPRALLVIAYSHDFLREVQVVTALKPSSKTNESSGYKNLLKLR